MTRIIFIIYFLFSTASLFAQTRQAYINAGTSAMDEGDYYTAGTFFEKALDFDEKDATTLYKMAEACRFYNDYQGAAGWYEKYLLSDKKNKNPLADFYLAEMKKYMGSYAESKKLFENYYSMHQNDSDYFSTKSFHEIASCDTAMRLIKDSIPADVQNAGALINSIYSDFGAQQLADSVIYFSSQRFIDTQKDKKKKQSYVSKILKSNNTGDKWQSPAAMDRIYNPPGYLNCNSSISADHQLIFFARCTPVTLSAYHAELFYGKWEKGKWQNPVKVGKEINSTSFTSTQPCIATNGANGYIIYFSSDRPGGYGGMDLWKCNFSNGIFSGVENLGPIINTAGNESTPYFDNLDGILYFSSDWHAGLGGYDIFKSRFQNNQYSVPENVGYPINSSCNDLYFTILENNRDGLLTSNRPGSMYLHSQTCCYDIYRFHLPEIKVVKTNSIQLADSILHAETAKRITDSLQLTTLLPLKLYFDNDQPGRRSTDTITNKTYEETYEAYLAAEPEYLNAFKSRAKQDTMQKMIDAFFKNTIVASHQHLEEFTSIILNQLNSGRKISMTVQGCASPLAKTEYNEKLSKRRIVSLVNYFKSYQNGILMPYLEDGKLIVVEDAAGELLAQKNVSDNFYDKRKSVYHPDACLERRIEVTAIYYLP